MPESQGAPEENPAPQKPEWMSEEQWQNRLAKLGRMWPMEVQLGYCENCHNKRVPPSGRCIQCGHTHGQIG